MKLEMNEGVVIIKLSEYENLKVFEKNVLDGNVVSIVETCRNNRGFYYRKQSFFNSKDVDDEILKVNSDLADENLRLQEIIDKLEYKQIHEDIDVIKIKQMSIWEFIKFRNS